MRILIVDDDATSRLLLKAIVTKLGHTCLVAEDGTTGWELLTNGGVDVLLTDWMMPGMDGPELCRRVRSEPGDRYIYVVLTTGLDHPEHILEGMSAGADDYLTKPVDSFAVQTRLVAAQRVTGLHRKLALTQDELERANLELLEQSRTDELTGLGNRRRMEEDLARTHARAMRCRPHLRRRALRHRLLQVLQRPLRPSGWRRNAPPGGLVHRHRGAGGRVRVPLRR